MLQSAWEEGEQGGFQQGKPAQDVSPIGWIDSKNSRIVVSFKARKECILSIDWSYVRDKQLPPIS